MRASNVRGLQLRESLIEYDVPSHVVERILKALRSGCTVLVLCSLQGFDKHSTRCVHVHVHVHV